MLFQKVALITALSALVAAQDIDQDDIPQQCTQVCAQVVTIARDCDNRHGMFSSKILQRGSTLTHHPDNDAAERNCICTAPNAGNLIPACEACVRQYDTDDDNDNDDRNDNDVRDVLTACNFTVQSSFNPTSASSVAAAASSAASASASTSGSVTVTRTSGTSVVTSVVATPQNSGNAAPAMTAAAGMGVGAFVVALGML